jgi:aminoglycoside phosphotransferase (APT) family kinase protein
MGAVWLVRDRFLDRLVALKVLLAEQATPEERERFLREARTSARLEHPHIIDVYRADETDGVVWFTMRYVDGESLGDRLRDRGALPVSEAVRVLREVAWGLAYAHARGVVHRDIKPDNILLQRDTGRAVVTDFGIARDAAQAGGLTMSGHVLGSVQYMSPEQASGEPLDGRSDIYALGCVGYHALCGRPPFEGSAQGVLVAQVTRPAPALGTVAPQVPASVAEVIAQCLAKDPSHRFATADAVADALGAVLWDAEASERAAADAAPGGVLSEADALAVWQRAAQLQAEAAHRMERTAALRPAVGSPGATATHREAGDTPPDTGQYRVRDVESAAVDAGISKQYVALALAEVRARAARGEVVRVLSDGEERRFTLFLGTPDRALSVSRVIPAPPKDVLAALGHLFTTNASRLELTDTLNGHPLEGGIMRFRMPRFTAGYLNPMAANSKDQALAYRLEQIELFDLNVTLHPRGTALAPACEVVITGDLQPGLRRNLVVDYVFLAAFAAAGALMTGGATLKAAGAAGTLLAGATGAVGALLGAGAGFVWYRWLFRRALAKAHTELGALLRSIEQHLVAQRLFQGEPPPRLRPPADGTASSAAGS